MARPEKNNRHAGAGVSVLRRKRNLNDGTAFPSIPGFNCCKLRPTRQNNLNALIGGLASHTTMEKARSKLGHQDHINHGSGHVPRGPAKRSFNVPPSSSAINKCVSNCPGINPQRPRPGGGLEGRGGMRGVFRMERKVVVQLKTRLKVHLTF